MQNSAYCMIQFLMTFWKEQNYRDMNQISGYQGAGSRERGLTVKENEEIFWNDGNVYLVCVGGHMIIHLSNDEFFLSLLG